MITRALIYYAAGSFGALLTTGIAHLAAHQGWMTHATSMAPEFAAPSLYIRLVWGGLWGFLLFLPGLKKLTWFQRAFLLACFPTLVQWLYFFPTSGAGFFGRELGTSTPVIVAAMNGVWSLVTTFFANKASRV